jgi:hypothetical protein
MATIPADVVLGVLPMMLSPGKINQRVWNESEVRLVVIVKANQNWQVKYLMVF